MWLAFLQGISFATAPLLSFSPFKIFIFSSALRDGWKRSLVLALSPLIADIPVVVGLWFFLKQIPDVALTILQILGGLFYIYLAVGLVRRAKQPMSTEKAEAAIEEAPRRTFWQAITAVWITPQVYINWSVIGIPAILRYSEASVLTAVAFMLGFYLLWVGGLAVQIILFGQAGKLSASAAAYVVYAASVLLIGFGIYQLWLGVSLLLTGS